MKSYLDLKQNDKINLIKGQGKKLNLFVSNELQETIKTAENVEEINLFTTEELFDIQSQITNSNFLTPFERMFWGINISENLNDLYVSPPTSVSIWVDYDYVSYTHWKNNTDYTVTLYVVHTKEDLLDLINWFIKSLNKSISFVDFYDNDTIATYVENNILEQLEG